jgi:hypothetical protein
MFLVGAEYNWYEYTHREMMMTHKLLIDEILNFEKISKKNTSILGINEDVIEEMLKQNLSLVGRTSSAQFTTKSSPLNESNRNTCKNTSYPISGNVNGSILVELLSSDEYRSKDVHKILTNTSRILENIRDKITIDGIVNPLKIFWIKADYNIVGRIIALLVSGLAMLLSTMFKAVDFQKYINSMNMS